jgi:asparaginyl-tRNA synthetase
MTRNAEPTRISDLPGLVGQTASLSGWVTHTRSSGKVAFVTMRDGTGILQAVVVKPEVSAEAWEAFQTLSLECSLTVTGLVKADARAPGGNGYCLYHVR